MSVLRDELDRRESEYKSMQNVLESKEFELVEATLEIQHLKSEQAFLKVSLKEKESELSQAQDTLDEVNQEILNLRTLLSKKDKNLTETTMILKEKEEHIEKIQHDLNVTNLKYFEATTDVERIVELTNKVINSMGYEDSVSSKEKQLETELDVVRETLSFMHGHKKELVRMAIEKFQLEAAQLEAEAATSALEITEMSRELLRTTNLVLDADYDLDISSQNIPEIEGIEWKDRHRSNKSLCLDTNLSGINLMMWGIADTKDG
nr:hypothetical protein [Tanacetum cinerariifolium]